MSRIPTLVCRVVGPPVIAVLAVACNKPEPAARGDAPLPPPTGVEVTTLGSRDTAVRPDYLEAGRHDPSWRRVLHLDTLPAIDSAASLESWQDIDPSAIQTTAMLLPLHGSVEGPSVLRTQVLLDRAGFSPGIIDGRWGKNTEKAIYWFQRREGLNASGILDERTFDRLVELAGSPDSILVAHGLSADDVEGPFVDIPDDIYRQAELSCMCYRDLAEKLAERFQVSRELLERLNPGIDLARLAEGDTLVVANVGRRPEASEVRRIVVSGGGFHLHALDEAGRILYHFPATLSEAYSPDPDGRYEVVDIAHDPWWHYQPELLPYADDEEEDAHIPPGPNNAVGTVWMALSEPHFGIHGTAAPETIGYATSAGCVRLTNWDAEFLARHVAAGTPVEFTDTGPAAGGR